MSRAAIEHQGPTRVDRQGFALAEVLIATVILSVGIVAALAAMRSGMRLQDVAENRLQAIYLAEEKLNLVGVGIPLAEGKFTGSGEGSQAACDWQLEIEPTEVEEVGDRLLRVTVTVTYPSRPQARTVSLGRWFLAGKTSPGDAESDLLEPEAVGEP